VRPSADPRAAYLADPAVLDPLRKAIRKIVPPSDVDDVVQNALVAALTDPNYPEAREVFIPWLLTKGRSRAIDHVRSMKHRQNLLGDVPEGGVDALPDGPVASASAAHDAAEAIRFTEARLDERAAGPSTTRSARWLMLQLRGENLEDIALDEGVTAKTVHHAVARLKRHLHAAWITAAAAVLLFFLVRGLYGRNPENERAHVVPAPSALPSVAPPAPQPPVPTREEFVRRLRDDAARECGAEEWERCMEDLQRAYQEDPEGNLDPGIQKLLGAARAHLPDPEAKPPGK
jgi:DNA-directed RNA polymerase specialized sigma24 family protein